MTPSKIPEKILYGAAYYPEVWPQKEMDKDIKYMKELNMNVMRIAEFAWVLMEPEEGRYEFDWLHNIIEKLNENDIYVILGTPTAAPPAWLTEKYPEVLPVDENGVQKTHGARRHYTYNSKKYQELSGKIAEKMALEFGDKPGVIAWQIDNEFGMTRDHSDLNKKAWHSWLKERYDSIEKLNQAWGTKLWSQKYDSFSRIPTGKTDIHHHPSLMFNWKRFISDSAVNYQQIQVEKIRKHSDLPVMHNMMPGQRTDYYKLNKDLDLVATDMYHSYQIYWRIASNYDRMRGFNKGPHLLLETAPNNAGGDVTYFIHRPPGAVRAAVWMNHALGGQASLYWLWRQHSSGQEMTHGAVLHAWGKPFANYETLCRIGKELKANSQFLLDNPVKPAKIALMYSHEAEMGLREEPYLQNVDGFYKTWAQKAYKPVQDSFLHRDVIGPEAEITEYEILIISYIPYIPQTTRKKLKEWVKQGGTLVLGPMAGYRDKEWTAFTDKALGNLEEWMGINVEARLPFDDQESPLAPVKLKWRDGDKLPVNLWGDILSSDKGTVLARYQNSYVDNKPAVVENEVGSGKVVLLGTDPGPHKAQELFLRLGAEKNISPVVTGESGVIAAPREGETGAVILVNVSSEDKKIKLGQKGRDRLTNTTKCGTITMSPYEVIVLET